MPKAFQQIAADRGAHPGLEMQNCLPTPEGVVAPSGRTATPFRADGIIVVRVPAEFAAHDRRLFSKISSGMDVVSCTLNASVIKSTPRETRLLTAGMFSSAARLRNVTKELSRTHSPL